MATTVSTAALQSSRASPHGTHELGASTILHRLARCLLEGRSTAAPALASQLVADPVREGDAGKTRNADGGPEMVVRNSLTWLVLGSTLLGGCGPAGLTGAVADASSDAAGSDIDSGATHTTRDSGSASAPSCANGTVRAKCSCGGAVATSGYCCDGQHQDTACPATSICATGAVNSSCACGGTVIAAGYCCGGQPATSSCPSGATCSTGAVSSSCSCGGSVVTSGYCCGGAYQSGACDLTTLRIDAGLVSGTSTYDGYTFVPLLPYLTAGVANNSTLATGEIADTNYDGLYLSETWVDYTQAPAATFTIPVANGNYSVYLHFVDWSSQTSKPGDRLFDVDLDGTREITDLDIIAAVGKDTALVESFDVSVTTGSIVLTLTADVFYPEIAAMEILPQGTPHFPTTTTPACGTGAVSAKCKCSASVVSTGYCCDGTVETSACSASSCPDGAVTSSCACGGSVVTGGYCCAGSPQAGACAAGPAACAGGQVTAACLCGTKTVSSGYCCSGVAQTGSCGTPSPNAYYVATTGSDTNDGSAQHPFLTLEKAQTAVQSLVTSGGVPAGGWYVYLRAGVYQRTATLTLTSSDSGPSSSRPITWAAYPGEIVRLTGGQIIPSSAFVPYTAVSGAYSVNLATLGISQGTSDYGYGSLVERDSWDVPDAAQLEVFFNDVPMTLARWPNVGQTGDASDGYSSASIPGWAQVYEYSSASGGFNFMGDRPSGWQNPTTVWIAGRPAWVWDQTDTPIADISGQHIDTVDAFDYPAEEDTNGPGSVFFAYNILEELDAPNEYYLDQSASMLYFYPPSDLSQATVSVSLLGDRMLIVDGTASNITFSGLIFEVSRAPLIDVQNGASNILFDSVTIRNNASYGATIGAPSANGATNGIQNSVVSGAGDWGIQTEGPSTFVTNSEFFNVARWGMVYKPAIWLMGGGGLAKNNYIHDLPHQAIKFNGTNNTISYNIIKNVCTEADDSGAIYSYQKGDGPTTGSVITNNIIYDIPWTFSPMGEDGGGVNAIYLDGGSSGVTIENNILYNATVGVVIDYTATSNNIVNNMVSTMFWVGISEASYGSDSPTETVSTCNVGDGTNGYKSAYGTPNGFESNCDPADTTDACTPPASSFTTHANNMYDETPMFNDPAAGDFTLAAGSPVLGLSCFHTIDPSQIGIQ